MLGFIVSNQEVKEIEFLLKREMEEILLDLQDSRIEFIVKETMEERYQVLFKLLKRIAPSQECTKYIRSKSQRYL